MEPWHPEAGCYCPRDRGAEGKQQSGCGEELLLSTADQEEQKCIQGPGWQKQDAKGKAIVGYPKDLC